MKRIWKLAGIALMVAVLGVGAVSTVAYAQEDEAVHPFDFVGKFKEAIAGILGITVEEYEAAVDQAQGQVTDQALAEGWLTEEQAERMQERFAEGPGAPGMMGRGMKGGPIGRGDSSLIGIAAEMLDMSAQDLHAELQDGKSIADVAAEKAVDSQAILDAYLAELETDLAEAVAEGKITQNQADWQLEQAGERGLEQLNGTFEGKMPGGPRGGGRPGGRPGGMKSAPAESDA